MCQERATFILSVLDKAGIVVQCVGCRLRRLKSYLCKVGLEFLDVEGSRGIGGGVHCLRASGKSAAACECVGLFPDLLR